MRELTPKHLMCGIGSCPSIFEIDEENIVVVGKELSPEMREKISFKVGDNENAVIIRKEFFAELN